MSGVVLVVAEGRPVRIIERSATQGRVPRHPRSATPGGYEGVTHFLDGFDRDLRRRTAAHIPPRPCTGKSPSRSVSK